MQRLERGLRWCLLPLMSARQLDAFREELRSVPEYQPEGKALLFDQVFGLFDCRSNARRSTKNRRKSVFMPMTSPRASNPKKGKKIRNNTMAVAMICSGVPPPMAANDAPIVFP